jgi:hypothetical protein
MVSKYFGRKTQKRPLDLLQALIALGGVDVPVSLLTEALWPEAEGDAAYRAFERALCPSRRVLNSAGALVLAGGKLSLDAGSAGSTYGHFSGCWQASVDGPTPTRNAICRT